MSIKEPQPDVHPFSDGYYLINGLYVEPSDVELPRVQSNVYNELSETYYNGFDIPLIFRHNGAKYHFSVNDDPSVRSDTIEVPYRVVDEMNIEYVPSEQQFLMAKPGHAKIITDFSQSVRSV